MLQLQDVIAKHEGVCYVWRASMPIMCFAFSQRRDDARSSNIGGIQSDGYDNCTIRDNYNFYFSVSDIIRASNYLGQHFCSGLNPLKTL